MNRESLIELQRKQLREVIERMRTRATLGPLYTPPRSEAIDEARKRLETKRQGSIRINTDQH